MLKCRFQLQPRHRRESEKHSAKLSHQINEPTYAFSVQETNAAPSLGLGILDVVRCWKGSRGISVVAHAWYGQRLKLATGIWLPAPTAGTSTTTHPRSTRGSCNPIVSDRLLKPLVDGRVAFVDDRRVYKYFWSSLQTSVQPTNSCS